jgi:flagellar biosynthesis GTPase FlhF
MKDNSILNKVRELLGMEVKLGTRKLDDGVTTIEAEEFEAGFQVVIVTEDEQKIPLPVGEYKLEDGLVLVVAEEGLIAEIKEEVAEEEVVEEEVVEEEVEATVEEAKPIKKTVESIVKETFFSEMEALKKENEELKSELEKFSKVENNENTNEEVVEETKEEVKEEVVELSEEKEVEAAAKPIVHNPENKEAKIGKTISPNRKRTIMDTVLSKINNANNN